jgi:hypothetical protein
MSRSSLVFSPSRLTGVLTLRCVIALIGLAIPSTTPIQATPINYTMTLSSVTGTYGNTGFTNQPMTLKFVADTANLVTTSTSSANILFPNGAGITVTIGSTSLSDTPLDDIPANTSLISSGINVFGDGRVDLSGGSSLAGRAAVVLISNPPASGYDILAQQWSGSGSSRYGSVWQIGNPSYEPLIIAGQELGLTNAVDSGSWVVTAVPEPSTYAMALAGLACGGWQMWRRRRLRQAPTLAA